ncbi:MULTISPECIES: hypothetical protein [Bombella]|uniref:Uncharacterized protein n=2 Tax=Bombella TaxID=1654741 RepID=A0ABT3WQ35_9PROT|nr:MULTISPECIES: hypothetical protein [Bombella]MCT6837343.1 hypothetical protein [Bifidobacteriales bacterium]MCT6854866.1 hypothetical protein [Bombella apis]PHI96679.1 hypothetical protein BG621_02685 [Parasaccharibacter apium]MCX5614721.1 hypothetical protein [Bombella saccharophila]MCX5618926.1 hypothetical protein [Bombella pollinis]
MADALNVDALKTKAEQTLNKAGNAVDTDALKAKAHEQARQAQHAFNELNNELKQPKGRCQCVGHTLLWGGIIVAALAGLCAIGRWLKK